MRPLEVNELPHCANCGQLTTWETVNKEFEGKTSEEVKIHREKKYLNIGKKFVLN